MVSAHAAIELQRQATPLNKDRAITDVRAKEITNLRSKHAALDKFMQAAKSKVDNLFKKQPLQRAFQNGISLDVDVDLTHLRKTLETVTSFIQAVCSQWEDDINMLVDIIRSWGVPKWEEVTSTQVNTMLDNKDFIKAVLNNPQVSRIKRSLILMQGWKAKLHAINNDGHGTIIRHESYKKWKAVMQTGADLRCSEFAFWLRLRLRLVRLRVGCVCVVCVLIAFAFCVLVAF